MEKKEDDNGQVVKTFKTWIVLNTRNGQFRTLKKVVRLNPSEVAIDMNLDVVLPKPAVIVAKGRIELSSSKMAEMTLEALEE